MLALYVFSALDGVIGGLAVGLLGVGATLIVLPTLIIFFPLAFPVDVAIKMAVATTLANATVAAGVTSWHHFKQKNIDWRIFICLAPIYAVTALLGAEIANHIPVKLFAIIIVVVLLTLAVLINLPKRKIKEHALPRQLSIAPLSVIAVFAALANSITGVATGTMMIPFLSRYRTHIKAAATSVTSTLFSCGVAALAFIFHGLHLQHSDLPPYSLGYLYLPVFFILAVGILFSAPIGVRLAKRIKTNWLRRIFGVLLVISAVSLILHFW